MVGAGLGQFACALKPFGLLLLVDQIVGPLCDVGLVLGQLRGGRFRVRGGCSVS